MTSLSAEDMSRLDHSENSTSELLTLAQEAAHRCNWELTAHHLHRLLQKSPPQTHSEAFIWRDLALRTLEMGDFHVRWDIAKLIARCDREVIGPEDVVSLLTQATDEDWSLSWFLVRILGEFRRPESVSTFIDLLQRSPSEDVVTAIVTALSEIGEPAVASVSQLLEQPQTRPAAVQVLARIRHPAAVAAIASAAGDADPAIRALAISTLGDAQQPQAQPILIAALSDVAAEVRRAAVIGLGSRKSTLSPAAIAKMGKLLWDISLSVRRAAILALSRLRCKGAADLLYDALRSRNTPPVLQRELVQALAFTETIAGIDYIAAYALDRQDLNRKNLDRHDNEEAAPHWISDIATSLGRIEAPDLVPAAVSLLTRLLTWTPADHSVARQTIATSLGQLGQTDSVDTLIAMLGDADVGVRLHITAALRKLAPEEAYHRLAAIAASPQVGLRLKQNAALALRDWEQSARSQPIEVSDVTASHASG